MRLLPVIMLCTSGACRGVWPYGEGDGRAADAALQTDGRADGLQPTDATQVDSLGTCTLKTLEILSGEDDIEYACDNILPDGELTAVEGAGFYLGWWYCDGGSSDGPTRGAFRFTLNTELPPGATIASASLELWGVTTTANWYPAILALEIAIEASPDAARLTSSAEVPQGGDPQARLLAPARVRWPAGGGLSWRLGAYNTSPDLAPLLQGLVDRYAGLASGAAVMLWITAAPGVADHVEVATNDASQPDYQPHRLVIETCGP